MNVLIFLNILLRIKISPSRKECLSQLVTVYQLRSVWWGKGSMNVIKSYISMFYMTIYCYNLCHISVINYCLFSANSC